MAKQTRKDLISSADRRFFQSRSDDDGAFEDLKQDAVETTTDMKEVFLTIELQSNIFLSLIGIASSDSHQ